MDEALRAAFYYRPGPYASVYVDLLFERAGYPGALARWRAELTRQGAGDQLVDAVRHRVLGAAPGPGVLALFAAGERVLLAADVPGSTVNPARYGGLPHVLPLLEWLQNHPAYVTAVVDRAGADITLFPGAASRPIHRTVVGPDDEIERSAPGQLGARPLPAPRGGLLGAQRRGRCRRPHTVDPPAWCPITRGRRGRAHGAVPRKAPTLPGDAPLVIRHVSGSRSYNRPAPDGRVSATTPRRSPRPLILSMFRRSARRSCSATDNNLILGTRAGAAAHVPQSTGEWSSFPGPRPSGGDAAPALTSVSP